MIEVRHIQCGATAFKLRLDEAVLAPPVGENGVILTSDLFVYDDGRKLRNDDGDGVSGDIITCQACGRAVSLYGFPPVADSAWP